MNGELPSIPRAAGMAWTDMIEVFKSLPVPTLIAAAIVLVLTVLAGPMQSSGEAAIAGLIGLVQSVLLVPYLIIITRFIILGERATGYPFAPWDRTLRYLGWTIALGVISIVIIGIAIVVPLLVSMSTAIRVVLIAAFLVAAIYLLLRLVLLLPAVAVDAQGATLANAWADSQGHVLRIFLIMLLVFLPFFIVVFVIAFIAALIGLINIPPAPPTFLHRAFDGIFTTLLTLVATAMAASVTARLCETLANRLRQPA